MKDEVNIEVDELNLEDLLILGDDKKIGIEIEFPIQDKKGEYKTVKTKAMVKQLTLKEINKLKLINNNLLEQNLSILKRALFTSNGEPFPEDKLMILPLGVANAISEKILEISGVDVNAQKKIRNF